MRHLILSLAVLAVLGLAPAYAFTPQVGDRAAELSGRDSRTEQMFHLSEQAGKWTFVDFWAYT